MLAPDTIGSVSSAPAHTEDTWSGAASLSVALREWLSREFHYGCTNATSSWGLQDCPGKRASVR